jgi:hypothetical protein
MTGKAKKSADAMRWLMGIIPAYSQPVFDPYGSMKPIASIS